MTKPNILFILNDHQTYYGHGDAFGGLEIQRPNFERIAKGGIEFTNAYTASPLCGPARRTILTGLYPHNHKEILNEVCHPFDRKTYLEILAENGYKNYYYGKWHAGPETAHELKCEGFSYPRYGNPYITPAYKEYITKNNLPHFEVKLTHSFYNPEWKSAKEAGIQVGVSYTPSNENYDESVCGIMTTPEKTHEAFFLADLACEQLDKIATSNDETPFNMSIHFWGPHPPYFVSQECLDLYNPQDFPEYPNFADDLRNKPEIYQYDMYYPIAENGRLIIPNPLSWDQWRRILPYSYAHTTLIDKAGGMILDKLDELGLSENTIVIWTLDHGDALGCHGGHFDKDCYMPEEMIKVPFAMRYPQQIDKCQKSSRFVSNIDIAPTLLDVAGLEFEDPIDGRSLLPVCIDPTIEWREDIMVETHGHKHIHLGRAIITKRFKYVFNDKFKNELYDLSADPYELKNLIDDDKYYEILADLKSRLKIWRARTNDPFTKKREIRKFFLRK
ncbi:MAG: sulfatase-like hydrolase/transferase [Candidatus Lokiarchaeota archaeon]|nr:sulfatase-like hydrolase/transferase [Candidatus Lokiarchaeota archaeon]